MRNSGKVAVGLLLMGLIVTATYALAAEVQTAAASGCTGGCGCGMMLAANTATPAAAQPACKCAEGGKCTCSDGCTCKDCKCAKCSGKTVHAAGHKGTHAVKAGGTGACKCMAGCNGMGPGCKSGCKSRSLSLKDKSILESFHVVK